MASRPYHAFVRTLPPPELSWLPYPSQSPLDDRIPRMSNRCAMACGDESMTGSHSRGT